MEYRLWKKELFAAIASSFGYQQQVSARRKEWNEDAAPQKFLPHSRGFERTVKIYHVPESFEGHWT